MQQIIEPSYFHITAQPSVLYEFFQRSARRWPDAIAVDVPPAAGRSLRKTITYAELEREVDILARTIYRSIGCDHVVAIFLRRNSE